MAFGTLTVSNDGEGDKACPHNGWIVLVCDDIIG